MAVAKRAYFLTVNPGSSSLKIKVFEAGPALRPVLEGSIQEIGSDKSTFMVTTNEGHVLKNTSERCNTIAAAAELVAEWLFYEELPLTAVGYRIVQGGETHREPELINFSFLAYLESIRSLASTHITDEVEVLRVFMKLFPALRHIACFDTFFHRTLPSVAQHYPVPRSLWKEGVHKYGFHGLSYEFIMQYLQQSVPAEANGKIIIAHLGNGCSLAAVHNGMAVDTTMGMTPAGGLMMGTRCGDIDPGVLLYLLMQKKMPPMALDQMLNHASGLKGVSELSADMEILLRMEKENDKVAEALELFCYNVRKMIGSMAAVLNGLDTLVFTGGIGEHTPSIRKRICAGLEYLGVRIGPGNERNNTFVSSAESVVKVRVVKTDEAYMIAVHMRQFI